MSNINGFDREKIEKLGYDLSYLSACTIHGQQPENSVVDAMEFDDVYKMAEFHSMRAISYASLGPYLVDDTGKKASVSDANLLKWKESKGRTLRKHIIFDSEREKIFSFMEQKHIWYAPLKGVLLREFYPHIGFRELTDNDILFDSHFRSDVHDFMTSIGYTALYYCKSSQDVYQKKPSCNFEMHVSLFEETHGRTELDRVISYYSDIKSRLIANSETSFGYRFSDEDMYIYLIAHAYKHYVKGGIGLRSLVDVYVYLNRKMDELNFEYIQNELNKLGVTEFESVFKGLALKLFGDCRYGRDVELDAEEKNMFVYLVSSGTHGTLDNFVKNGILSYGDTSFWSKLKYLFRKLFADEHSEAYKPSLGRNKLTAPFYAVGRIVRAMFKPRYWKELYLLLKSK